LLLSDYALPVNVGNPDEVSILDFAKEILSLVNNPAAFIDYQPLPLDDPKVRQPDITLAKKWLQWEPKMNRKDGLRITYEYFKAVINI
jgi:dTDP-glucose 4,6-dehydratase